ncbi:Cna protein B-type domain protein, collagen-binding protein [Bifidobacterium saguini DSM 23967]|uniref:Cna protein B-type domain protein, collagen-binding protein n=2 Tax=Bifidobacterium saguini TaxID=762210 RepID=A0A087DES2_9BIFI|nr:SpaA isopeptide-forming pilin-related protein [Bifidobacterium saguini]KFI94022.1 Cna protein B-type domain protein, collagen-binding protein [Bifidobacterium saguini DSM 23967]QTB90335.1 hypothetical protein BSD967_08320 [Bifidobacterium saguini]
MRKIADLLNAAKKRTSTTVNRATAAIVALAMLGTVAGVSATAMAQDENASDAQTQTTQAQTVDGQAADAQNAQTTENTDANATQSDDSAASNTSTEQVSNTAADTPSAQADDAFDAHTVTGYSPTNITTDLFDYWLTGQNDQDNNDDISSTLNEGINAGHQLKFLRKSYGSEGGNLGRSANSGSMNAWTGKSSNNQGGPFAGMVESDLQPNDDGYPQLKAGQYYEGQDTRNNGNRLSTDTGATTSQESLAYLFNNSAADGKAVYSNVKGLFQINDDGLYTYDSQKNFASYDQTSNSFKLYDSAAVNTDNSVADQSNGQFFPFNTANQVFNTPTDGQKTLTAKDGLYSTNQVMNHYFGLHMRSEFVQPTGGKVNGKDMVFNFSGDDDVWVFIDGKLVGDVGGMHDRLQLSINFATGIVSVTNGASYDDSTTWSQVNTTLRKALGLNSTTLENDSEHTLDFFYLERGNGNSNLKLETNLATRPANELIKVDQTGTAIQGVHFDLYQADANYNKTSDTPVADGTTDPNGQFDFTESGSNKLLSLSELYGNGAHPYYVVEENAAPKGYRKAQPMQLKLQTDAKGNVYATAANKFQTGAIASPRVQTTITATSITGKAEGKADSTSTAVTDDMLKNGKIVAVPMRFNTSTSCPDGSTGKNCWVAVTGDAENGWTEVTDSNGNVLTGFASILAAAQLNYKKHGALYNTFAKNENAQWSVDVNDLPGEINEYYYAATNNADINYAIGYFYIPTSSLQGGSSTAGMYHLDSENYDRKYASVLQIPNIKNILVVQKTDADGQVIKSGDKTTDASDDEKATFALYADNNGQPGDKLSDKQTTDQNVADGRLGLAGAVSFPSDKNDTASLLETGKTYWVKETAHPKGYLINDHWIKVIVDDAGVHADATGYVQNADGSMSQVKAGTDDNITVNVGLGTLVRTMTQWAGDGGDDPLQFVNGLKQTGTENNGAITWIDADTSSETIRHFQYGYGADADVPLLKYGYFALDRGWNRYAHQTLLETTFESEDGFSDVKVTPCPSKSTTPDGCNAPADLQNASPLFTGSTIIRVADETTDAHARVEMNKKVEGGDWSGANGKNFTFTMIRTDNESGDVTVPGNNAPQKLLKCDVTGLDWSSCDTADTQNNTVKKIAAHTVGAIKKDKTQTVGLNADGTATAGALPELKFTAAGTYTFLLKEDTANAEKNWKYDTSSVNGENGYSVKITVTRNDTTGELTAVITYGDATGEAVNGVIGAAPTFVNHYIAPVSALPLTGGMSARNWLIFGGLAVVAAAVAAMIVNEYRKRNGLML